jgi:hypothetical protein
MTAGLHIFQVKLPEIGPLSVFRSFNDQSFPFRLEAGGDTWSMTVNDAARLGRCADTIARRFHGAATRGDSVKAGPVFRRKDDAGALIIEIGIDDDDTMYLQLFELPRVTLRDAQSRALLAALQRVGEDARTCGGDALGLAR